MNDRLKYTLLSLAALLVLVLASIFIFVHLRILTPGDHPLSINRPAVSSTDTSSAPMPIGIQGVWKLVFDDEFNGSTLNLANWCPNWVDGRTCSEITTPVNPYEMAAYDPAQVTVSGGYLHLTLIEDPVTLGGDRYQYRSGMVQTNGKVGQTPLHQFTFGAFEARIFLPGSEGKITNWPAWWTDGQHWPTDGEMDILEGLSGAAQYHFHSDQTGDGGGPVGDFTGWHTYAGDWEKGRVTFYYDGLPVGALDWGITDAPMYLILNYATGGSYSGQVMAPATMLVDYVRVWQH